MYPDPDVPCFFQSRLSVVGQVSTLFFKIGLTEKLSIFRDRALVSKRKYLIFIFLKQLVFP